MTASVQPRFHYLRSKIREWKAGDLLHPGDLSLKQFQQIAPLHLLPMLADLHQALEAEGLRTTVRDMAEEMGFISLTIDDFDVELSFGPCEYPHAFRMFTCRMASQEAVVTRVLTYHDLEMDVSGVLKVIEEVVLCALGPRRANGPKEGGEPPDSHL